MTPSEDPDKKPGAFALISVQGTSSLIIGLRALVRRSALHADSFRYADGEPSVNEVINSGWLHCNKPDGYQGTTTAAAKYQMPGFRTGDRYLAGRGAIRCAARTADGREQFSPDCAPGSDHQNYVFPRPNAAGVNPLPSFPRVIVVSGSTTGITAGGITRGVRRVATTGLDITIRDTVDYVDHNVPCSYPAVAKWMFASFNGVYGWLPRRNAELPAAEFDPFVRNSSSSPGCS